MAVQPVEQWRPVLKVGMTGEDVRAWQSELLLAHYDLGLSGADGVFGTQTHNATVAWQRDRGWQGAEVTGEVGELEREALLLGMAVLSPPGRMPRTLEGVEYVEASNWSSSLGTSQVKRLIVLHSMEAPEASTTARRTAEWFATQTRSNSGTSAHACVDDSEVLQCVPWGGIAWHAPGANQLGIGIEHAGYARQTATQWLDAYGRRMLTRSAWLVSQLCTRYGIPAKPVTAAGLLSGDSGITTHSAVSQAYRKSNHTDPGPAFPLSFYIELVRASKGSAC